MRWPWTLLIAMSGGAEGFPRGGERPRDAASSVRSALPPADSISATLSSIAARSRAAIATLQPEHLRDAAPKAPAASRGECNLAGDSEVHGAPVVVVSSV